MKTETIEIELTETQLNILNKIASNSFTNSEYILQEIIKTGIESADHMFEIFNQDK